jgi:hypothetical protein
VRGALALILAAIGSGYQKIMISTHDYQTVIELDPSLSAFLIEVDSLARAYEIITGKSPEKSCTRELAPRQTSTTPTAIPSLYDSII